MQFSRLDGSSLPYALLRSGILRFLKWRDVLLESMVADKRVSDSTGEERGSVEARIVLGSMKFVRRRRLTIQCYLSYLIAEIPRLGHAHCNASPAVIETYPTKPAQHFKQLRGRNEWCREIREPISMLIALESR